MAEGRSGMNRLTRTVRAVLCLSGAALFAPMQLEAQGERSGAGQDFGIGIVSFAFVDSGAEWPAADTMLVHEAASAGAPVVARFIFQVPEPMSWAFVLETGDEAVESNAVEYGYEVLGLPVDAVEAGGEWARVIYGTAADATPRTGWVRIGGEGARLRLWSEVLPEQSLFFVGPSSEVAFYDRPGGGRVSAAPFRESDPQGAAFDLRMEPLEVDGRWMKVRVVTPDDSCRAELVETKEDILWIEYLDPRGRPRVWYHTRGC